MHVILSHDMEASGLTHAPDTRLGRADLGSRDELTLSDVVRPLWDSRYVIVALALLFGALAFAYRASLRPRYEATVVVRVIESKSVDQAEPARAENFRPLLENKTIAAGLVKDFTLVDEPRFKWGGPGAAIAADRFVADAVRVDQVVATNLLRVRVTLGEPQAAAAVANALVARAIDLNRTINQQEVIEARDYIKSQLDEATVRVERVRSELVAMKQRSQVDALKSDAEGALDLRGRLLELQSSIENERAYLGRSEADLRQSQPTVTTRRSIDRAPALMEYVKEQVPATSVLGLSMTDEQVNEAHADLQERVSQSRATLAGLESQRRLLVDDKHLDRAVMPTLTKLYEAEVAVSRLQAEYDMALKVYVDLATRYEDARIRVGGRGVQLQVVDPALPPSRPAASRLGAIVILSLLCGALIASLGALARQFLAPHVHV